MKVRKEWENQLLEERKNENLEALNNENPIQKLNELFLPPNNPQYRIIIPDDPPEEIFSIELCVQGKKYFGKGKSKKEAKRMSAQKAVEGLNLEIKNHETQNSSSSLVT